MPSPLGLSTTERYNARQRVKRAAMLAYNHRASIHYTQGALRWSGINQQKHAAKGQYPSNCDCSSFGTWCLWDATFIHRLWDFVNGSSWRYGYTGTMVQHGQLVRSGWLLVGDQVFYGGTSAVPGHVATVVVGGRVNKARVVSHGSESGPLLLQANYRTINQIRRYIR